MGTGCGCSRTTGPTLENSVATSIHRRGSDGNLSVLRRVERFYSVSRDTLPDALRIYYTKVIEGKSKTVTNLTLKMCGLGLTDVRNLARIMPFYKDIQELRLEKNELDSTALEVLIDALDAIEDLRIFALIYNDIGDQGITHISKGFPRWENLQEIWLSTNKINSPGAKSLSAAMKNIHKLELLNLDCNNISTEGCAAICQALLNLSPLRVLSLQENAISASAESGLESLGRQNPPEELTDLHANLFDETDCAKLKTAFGAEKVNLR